MRPGRTKTPAAVLAGLAAGFVALVLGTSTGLGDDQPSRLGRLFRFGGSSAARNPSPSEPSPSIEEHPGPVSVIPAGPGQPQPRLIPQPRVTRPVTDADPIVTRIALGRSDNGAQFGMFLQVYADGTIIDSEGVHRLGRDAIKDVLAALEQGELYRVRGHCGSPSTDFIENVQMVVYERSFGRLRANAFSFSGSTQGCDHAVRRLQTALDALQMKLSRPAGSAPSVAAAALSAAATGALLSPLGPPIQLNGESSSLPR